MSYLSRAAHSTPRNWTLSVSAVRKKERARRRQKKRMSKKWMLCNCVPWPKNIHGVFSFHRVQHIGWILSSQPVKDSPMSTCCVSCYGWPVNWFNCRADRSFFPSSFPSLIQLALCIHYCSYVIHINLPFRVQRVFFVVLLPLLSFAAAMLKSVPKPQGIDWFIFV